MLLLLTFSWITAESRITFFFKPQPLTEAEKISEKLKKPGKLAQYVAHGKTTQAALEEGIVVTYGGYVIASDHNGEVNFPRKHQKSGVDILITSDIEPVPLFENTILHWTRVPGVPAKVYSCEQKYDEKKGQYYWKVEEVPLTDDMVIPLATIIILAKPNSVSMTEGITPAHESTNLVLPDLYVHKGITTMENNMHMLTIRHLFKPVDSKENRQPLKMLTHLID